MNKMIKNILLFVTLTFMAINLFSANYTTTKSGLWTDNTVWDLGVYPNSSTDNAILDNNDSIAVISNLSIGLLTFSNNSILYIAAGYTLTVDSISILNNAVLHVEGSLIVSGGVSMANNSSLNINLSGGVDIGGSFSGGNNVDVSVDGVMDVTGNVDLGSGSTVSGTGDVYVQGDVNIPAGSDPGQVINPPLPIELLSFKADKHDNFTTLQWSTASEINNDYFLIEYSINGTSWNYLCTVDGAGYSYSTRVYTYDHITYDLYYYRLSQFDYDGKSETFNMIKSYDINTEEICTVYNLSGYIVFQGNINNISEKLENGVYIVFDGYISKKIAIFK